MFNKLRVLALLSIISLPLQASLPYQTWEAHAAKHDVSVPLLYAIALKESGKTVDGKFAPHPYAIGIGVDKSIGQLGHHGLYFDSKEEAVHALQSLLAAGYINLGLGMMQVNIMANPGIVDNYADLFDAEVNISAAGKVIQYCKRFGSLDRLLSCYSHGDPNSVGGKRYANKVFSYQDEYGKRFAQAYKPNGQLTYQQFLQFTQYRSNPPTLLPVGQVRTVTMVNE
jgi:hypothetical protein